MTSPARRAIGVAAFAIVACSSIALRSQQAPAAGRGAAPPDAAAVERGRTLFVAHCASCHGMDGRGGPQSAIDLSQSAIAAGDSEVQSLGEFLRIGWPERRMPAFFLADADVGDLTAFMRTVAFAGRGRGRGPVAIVVGAVKAGEAFFNGDGGCTKCHAVTGDLKGIGARLTAATIQGRIVLPRGDGGYPRSFLSPEAQVTVENGVVRAPATARTVTVTPPGGTAVSGTLLWITDFNVTLVDVQGVRRTFARNGDIPKVEITDPLQAHLDMMRKLTDKQMHDLTAYLVAQK